MIITHYKLDGSLEREMAGYTGDNCFVAAAAYDQAQPGDVEKTRTAAEEEKEANNNYENI